jgi:hypothetical protein
MVYMVESSGRPYILNIAVNNIIKNEVVNCIHGHGVQPGGKPLAATCAEQFDVKHDVPARPHLTATAAPRHMPQTRRHVVHLRRAPSTGWVDVLPPLVATAFSRVFRADDPYTPRMRVLFLQSTPSYIKTRPLNEPTETQATNNVRGKSNFHQPSSSSILQNSSSQQVIASDGGGGTFWRHRKEHSCDCDDTEPVRGGVRRAEPVRQGGGGREDARAAAGAPAPAAHAGRRRRPGGAGNGGAADHRVRRAGAGARRRRGGQGGGPAAPRRGGGGARRHRAAALLARRPTRGPEGVAAAVHGEAQGQGRRPRGAVPPAPTRR